MRTIATFHALVVVAYAIVSAIVAAIAPADDRWLRVMLLAPSVLALLSAFTCAACDGEHRGPAISAAILQCFATHTIGWLALWSAIRGGMPEEAEGAAIIAVVYPFLALGAALATGTTGAVSVGLGWLLQRRRRFVS